MRRGALLVVGRVSAVLALLVVQLSLALAPHRHTDSLLELWRQESGIPQGEVHEISCAQPRAIHWHADHPVMVDPCLACLRQHLVATLGASPSPITTPAAPAPLPITCLVVRPAAVGGSDCRAPPYSPLTRAV